MKKLIGLMLIGLLMVNIAFAGDEFDKNTPEVRPTVTKYLWDSVILLVITKTAIVRIREGYMDGDEFVHTGDRKLLFIDVVDDPDTEDDETQTGWTDLLTAMSINKVATKAYLRTQLP